MTSEAEYIIIGSGISSLVCAAYLTLQGKSVIVLEKNHQIGGMLQVFARDKKIFDTGVHYVGSMGPGELLHEWYDYLGIMDRLELTSMDRDGFDQIHINGMDQAIKFACGWEQWSATLIQAFPQERAGIEALVQLMQATVNEYGPFYLSSPIQFNAVPASMSSSALKVIQSFVSDPKCIAALGGNSITFGGHGDSTPFYQYSLIQASYIAGAYRMNKGGSNLAKQLSKVIHRHGGKIRKFQEVVSIEHQDGVVTSVKTRSGHIFSGNCVISGVHPAITLGWIHDYPGRKVSKERILNIPNHPSLMSFQFSLKRDVLPYFNCNYFLLSQDSSAWYPITDSANPSWPDQLMISTCIDQQGQSFAKSVTVLVYDEYKNWKKWESTFNAVFHPRPRGDDYLDAKNVLTQRIIKKLESFWPNFAAMIDGIYVSTPLTLRDYIGSPEGSSYGIMKDYKQPLASHLSPKTKLGNLFFTGQNIDMHGIYGSTISALLTLNAIDNIPNVFDVIHSKRNQ